MSGFTYSPPSYSSSIYNPAFYPSLDASGFLTFDYAQTLYLNKNDYRLSYLTGITAGTAAGGVALVPDSSRNISGINEFSCTSLTVNGSSVATSGDLTYITGITAGTASASKALVVDANKDIVSIRNLSATNLTGTLQTAAQPNITSIGTLSSLTATSITGTLQTAAQPNITSLGTLTSLSVSGGITGTLQTAAQPNITSIGTLSTLTATSITGTLQTAAQPNVTSLGTLTSLTVSGALNGTLSTASQPNITSIGTLSSLSVSASNNTTTLNTYQSWTNTVGTIIAEMQISNIAPRIGTSSNHDFRIATNNTTRLWIDNLGNVNIGSSAPTGSYKLETSTANFTTLYQNGVQVATTTDTSYLSGITAGTASASKALVVDASKNITSINSVGTTSLVLGGNTLGATESAYLTSITAGTASASKALVLNASKNVSGINSITTTSITVGSNTIDSTAAGWIGGISSAGTAQSLKALTCDAFLSVSGLSSVGTTSLVLGGNTLGATESAYLTSISAGTASASKALVLDSNKYITGISRVNLTSSDSTARTGTTTAANYGLNILGTVNSNGQYNATSIAFLNAASDAMPQAAISLDRIAADTGDLVFATRNPTNNVSEALRMKSTGALNINTSSTNAMVNCIGSASYTDGSYQRLLSLQSTNINPVSFEVQVNSGDAGTSTNGVAIGTFTSNDLRLMTNDATKMIILANGRVGIGTTSPSFILDVSGSVSTTIDSGGLGYGQLSKTATSFTIGPLSSQSISARFSASTLITSGSYFTTSDRRIKKDIEPISPKLVESFMQIDPCTYLYKNQNETETKQIGYIAQDLVAKGLTPLVNFIENESMKVEAEGDLEGYQLSVDYSKICCLLHKKIQMLEAEIKELKKPKA